MYVYVYVCVYVYLYVYVDVYVYVYVYVYVDVYVDVDVDMYTHMYMLDSISAPCRGQNMSEGSGKRSSPSNLGALDAGTEDRTERQSVPNLITLD